MKHPFKAFLDIRKGEWALSLLMFFYFFLVITSFWILKPIKKSVFIGFYDITGFSLFGWHLNASQAELIAKILNMIVAFVAVIVFTWLSRRYLRHQLTVIFGLFCIIVYGIYSQVINDPSPFVVWTFYLYGDLFNTLMVATFFAFLNDSVTPEAAKRLYGLIVLGGVIGGAFGTLVLRTLIDSFSFSVWIYICLIVSVIIILVAVAAGSLVTNKPKDLTAAQEPESISKIKKNTNPALEGARLVFRSRYLLSIVLIVGLYEIASTTLDFQFTATIAYYLDGDAITRQLSTMYLIQNWAAMFIQFFLTSFIMTRLGLKFALLVLPVAIILGSTVYFLFPVLWIGSFLVPIDNSFHYSINQSAKETLYTITTREEKYKAKAFIDMFVNRFSKAVAVGVSLTITTVFTDFSSIRWISLFTIMVVLIWTFAAGNAGSEFQIKYDSGTDRRH